MKNLIQIIVLTILLQTINTLTNAQTTYVPDDNFEQALIDLGYDTGPLDDYVPTTNIMGVTELDVDNKNISDLTGIDGFTSLELLKCNGNQITTLDLQQNTNLTDLRCSNNQLTEINLLGNPNLEEIYFGDNQIVSLDLQNNTALTFIACDNNPITSFDLTNNPNMEKLFCSHTEVSSLIFPEDCKIYRLSCESANLTEIDVSMLADLDFLSVWNNEITTLDVSNNLLLTELLAGKNELESIYVPENNIINKIDCRSNNLRDLEELLNVDTGGNTILEQNPNLVTLNITSNNFDFNDLEPRWSELQQIPAFSYDNQGSIGVAIDTSVEQGTDYIIEIAGYTSAASDQYQWYKGAQLLAGETDVTLNFELIEYSDAGTYYCQVTNTTITDLTLTSQNIIIDITDPTGINDVWSKPVLFYPNPTSEILFVTADNEITKIQLTTLEGKVVIDQNYNSDNAVNLSHLPDGVYFLRLSRKENYQTERVVITRN